MMILQNTLQYAGSRGEYGLGKAVITLFRAFVSAADEIGKLQNQRQLYRDLKKVSHKQLADIGLSDPQAQIRIFGRYMDNGKEATGCVHSCSGGLSGAVW